MKYLRKVASVQLVEHQIYCPLRKTLHSLEKIKSLRIESNFCETLYLWLPDKHGKMPDLCRNLK